MFPCALWGSKLTEKTERNGDGKRKKKEKRKEEKRRGDEMKEVGEKSKSQRQSDEIYDPNKPNSCPGFTARLRSLSFQAGLTSVHN